MSTTYDFGDGKGPVPALRHKNPDGSVGGWKAGTAWVADTAYLGENARAYGNAQILEEARVEGNAKVCDDAVIKGEAEVSHHATISNDAVVAQCSNVSEFAVVQGHARIMGHARVSGFARVGGINACVAGYGWVHGYANVQGDARVEDNAIVEGKATVEGKAKIYEDARVSGTAWIADQARVCGAAHVGGNTLIEGKVKVAGRSSLVGGAPGIKIFGPSRPGRFVLKDCILTGTVTLGEPSSNPHSHLLISHSNLCGGVHIRATGNLGTTIRNASLNGGALEGQFSLQNVRTRGGVTLRGTFKLESSDITGNFSLLSGEEGVTYVKDVSLTGNGSLNDMGDSKVFGLTASGDVHTRGPWHYNSEDESSPAPFACGSYKGLKWCLYAHKGEVLRKTVSFSHVQWGVTHLPLEDAFSYRHWDTKDPGFLSLIMYLHHC